MTYDEAIRAATLNDVVLIYDTINLTVSAKLNGKLAQASYENVSRRAVTITVITEILGEQE